MTRILFIIDYLTLNTGGPRFLLEVFNILTKNNNYDVFAITGYVDRMVYKRYKKIKIYNLNTYDYKHKLLLSTQPTNILKFLFSTILQVNKLFTNIHMDIIHVNSHIPVLLSYLFAKKAPIVCSIHHLEEFYQFPSLLPKIAKVMIQDVFEVNNPCSTIHVPSNNIKKKIKNLSIVDRDNIVVIPPGIETARYLSIPKRPKENLFVMIGRLEKRKHYEFAVAAFKLVKRLKPDYKLYIVGEGPLRQYLQHLIRRFCLEGNVFLLGTIDEETKLNLLSRATALIHLGYPEGFGIVLLEALASGTPVIAYDMPPLNEVVRQGVTGVLVNKDDIVSLAKTITEFHRYSFDERILRNAARKYDISVIAKMFARLYASLVI